MVRSLLKDVKTNGPSLESVQLVGVEVLEYGEVSRRRLGNGYALVVPGHHVRITYLARKMPPSYTGQTHG